MTRRDGGYTGRRNPRSRLETGNEREQRGVEGEGGRKKVGRDIDINIFPKIPHGISTYLDRIPTTI